MKLFTVKGDRSSFVFKESKQVFPMVRAEITAHIVLEFAPTALKEWNRLSEEDKKHLIRTVAQKELEVQDLRVGLIDE